jgi:hypothetical protein
MIGCNVMDPPCTLGVVQIDATVIEEPSCRLNLLREGCRRRCPMILRLAAAYSCSADRSL